MELERILNDKNRKWWFCTIETKNRQPMVEENLIGFYSEIDDLKTYNNLSQIQEECNDFKKAICLWNFYREAQKGDIVFLINSVGALNSKNKKISGIAIIDGDYFYNKHSINIYCCHFRKVKYLKTQDVGEFEFMGTNGIYFGEISDEYKEKLYDLLTNKNTSYTNTNQLQTTLNQILYGPPGTGKTYHTIDRALKILGIDCKDKTREKKKELFEAYKQKGQIEFVTFHQSYSYEEFVEGIKPDEKEGAITYKTKNGIFKNIATKALGAIFQQASLSRIFYEYMFSFIKLQNEEIEIEETKFHFDNTEQAIICGKDFKVDCNTLVNFFNNQYIKNYPSYEALKKHYDNHFKKYTQIEFLQKMQTEGFYDAISRIVKNPEIPNPPYILIIDEINRGNISKIFGELITLIESSKRIGADEELRVVLPYSGSNAKEDESKELFGVPSNLYIIGTMNTADRSITSIDTALRRRFEFEEMMPDPSKLKDKNDIEGINLEEMLEAINERIEYLCGREKTIGHAYLIKVDSLQSLKNAFQNNIIPLLQEYFHNDYGAINAVLNDNGMIRDDKDFKYTQGSFKTFTDNRGISEKKVFRIATKTDKNKGSNKCVWEDPKTYIAIYDDKVSKELK